MLNLNEYRKYPIGFADLLNFAFMVDDGIMFQKDGSLMACFKYQAPDVFSATPNERNQTASRINNVLTKFGGGWAIQFDSVRTQTNQYPFENSTFGDPLTKMIDKERQSYFAHNSNLYFNNTYLTLTYSLPSTKATKISKMFFDDDAAKKDTMAEIMLKTFKTKLLEFVSLAVSGFVEIRHLKSEEMLSFLNLGIIGKDHPVKHPTEIMYLDSILSRNFTTGVIPKIDDQYMQIITIEGFSQTSYPNILDHLSHFEIDYRWNTKFVFLDLHEALFRLDKVRKRWKQKELSFFAQMFNPNTGKKDDFAQAMTMQTDSAIAEVNSGTIAYGYYSTNLVVFSTSREVLENQSLAIRSAIESAGFIARIEDINTVEAYLGTIPGNITPNIRRSLVGSMNLTHLLPLSTMWQGNKHNESDKFPPHSPALALTVSGSTPFYLNLHVSDIGHTLIFGPTGAGKSTLLAFLVAQAKRYQAERIFAFDKGMSLYPLTLASGGDHYNIAGDESVLAFAPLANLSKENMAWANTWVVSLLQLQGIILSPEDKELIHHALQLHQENQGKSLTDFISNLQSSELRAALNHYSISGAMGRLLDAEEDNLALSDFSVFEVEELMNLQPEDAIPVLLYIFYRIEKSLDGRPTFLILDEAWIMLGHPVFRDKIREWLKVLRKANCAVIIATQSLSDAAKSGILDVLQESCPTKILLPNDEAFNKGSDNNWGPYDYYNSFGLNDREIEIIATAHKKREYYYKSPHGSRLFNLMLGDFTLSFIGASGKKDIAKINELNHEFGNEWTVKWLEHRGVSSDIIDYYNQLKLN